MQIDLTGKVALVTGGAIRVGKVLAHALAKSGADVVVSHLGNPAEAAETCAEIRALGRKALAVEADMRSVEALRNLVDTCERAFGRLDILIHNASNFNEQPFDEVTEAHWDSSHDIILKGPFFLSQAAARLMLKHGGGRMIALIGNSYYENWPTYIPHSIAKVGLVKLMEGLAVALSPQIQCSAICPATIMTSAVGGYSPVVAQRGEAISEESRTVTVNGQVIRMGTPEEVAELVVFLCGCAGYLNGAVIPIDGGKHLL